MRKKLVFFGSGKGSNIKNCIQYFKNNESVEISKVYLNNKHSELIPFLESNQVSYTIFNRKEFLETDLVKNSLSKINPDLIVLAGFLLLFPENLISLFPNKIINLHPSLLPKYGGKGMYGSNVHQAVLENKEKISGITFHFVNSEFDKGEIIEQHECEVDSNDTIETLAAKIHLLEHRYLPVCIEKILRG